MRVRIRADILALSGYGHAARAYARALLSAGVECEFQPVRHDLNAMSVADLLRDPFWKARWKDLNRNATCNVVLWVETPEFVDPDPTAVNIAQVNWETSHIPSSDFNGKPSHNWVKQMNRLDGVLTSSQFSAGAFENSGVECPMIIVPMPVDIDLFSPGPKTDLFNKQNEEVKDKMTFLSVFQWNRRKNPEGLLTAWTTAFAYQEDVQLILKAYCKPGEEDIVRKQVKSIRDMCHLNAATKNIHLVTEIIPDAQMPDLYRSADVYVHVPYGEGWGIPVQEAMACGKPVIYSNNTSLMEFAVGYPVMCSPEPVSGMKAPWYTCLQTWYRPNPQSLIRALRKAYDDWKQDSSLLVQTGARARKKVEALHHPSIVGQQLADCLRHLTGETTYQANEELEEYKPEELATPSGD